MSSENENSPPFDFTYTYSCQTDSTLQELHKSGPHGNAHEYADRFNTTGNPIWAINSIIASSTFFLPLCDGPREWLGHGFSQYLQGEGDVRLEKLLGLTGKGRGGDSFLKAKKEYLEYQFFRGMARLKHEARRDHAPITNRGATRLARIKFKELAWKGLKLLGNDDDLSRKYKKFTLGHRPLIGPMRPGYLILEEQAAIDGTEYERPSNVSGEEMLFVEMVIARESARRSGLQCDLVQASREAMASLEVVDPKQEFEPHLPERFKRWKRRDECEQFATSNELNAVRDEFFYTTESGKYGPMQVIEGW